MCVASNVTEILFSARSTTIVLLGPAMFVVEIGSYIMYFLTGFVVLSINSFFAADAITDIHNFTWPVQPSGTDNADGKTPPRGGGGRFAMFALTVVGYLVALTTSFITQSVDRVDRPGPLVVTVGCTIGVLVGQGLCVVMAGLVWAATVICLNIMRFVDAWARFSCGAQPRAWTVAVSERLTEVMAAWGEEIIELRSASASTVRRQLMPVLSPSPRRDVQCSLPRLKLKTKVRRCSSYYQLALDRDGRIAVSDNASPEHLPWERVEVPEAEQGDEGDDSDEVEDWSSYAEDNWSD
ncbi:hypothetical protein LTR97_001813 [Elasticomyces elasticus]|uniref:Transmembrane protein n=1 Tax=Elasticomyces elasticus TaxID=574655 RepID=A0AAN7WJF2_9PEZI|nr:hypothetical protein LTR97_001813 [Elasticomyces elasticus]